MTRIAGLEGSYSVKTRRGKPTNKVTVKFCTGWDAERNAYAEVKRTVDSEKEAIAMMAAVTNFLNVEGGSKDEIEAFLDRAKNRRDHTSVLVEEVFEEFLEERHRNPDVAKRTVETNETHINRAKLFIGKRISESVIAALFINTVCIFIFTGCYFVFNICGSGKNTCVCSRCRN